MDLGTNSTDGVQPPLRKSVSVLYFWFFLLCMAVFFAAIKAHLSIAAYLPSNLLFHICYGYKNSLTKFPGQYKTKQLSAFFKKVLRLFSLLFSDCQNQSSFPGGRRESHLWVSGVFPRNWEYDLPLAGTG